MTMHDFLALTDSGTTIEPTVKELLAEGHDYISQRRLSDARDCFQAVLKRKPESAAAHEGLAIAYFHASDFDAAIEEYAQVARLRPQDGRPLFNRGALLNKIGKYQQAIASIKEGIKRDPKAADAFYNLGIAYRNANNGSLAIAAYREAIRLNPKFADAWYNLGNIYFDQRNFALAISSYEKAIELKPDFTKAVSALNKTREAVRTSRQPSVEHVFGRLVAEEAVQPVATVGQLPARTVTSEQLEAERQTVHELTRHIHAAAEELLQYASSDFEKSFSTLHRMVTDAESEAAMQHAVRRYREAVDRMSGYRRLLKRKLLELRAHEELLHTQEVQL